jgi:hypothetical protein
MDELAMSSICNDDYLQNVHVTDCKSSERGKRLGQQGLCLKHSIIFSPDSAHCVGVWVSALIDEMGKDYDNVMNGDQATSTIFFFLTLVR